MAFMEISIVPIGTGDTSVSEFIADIYKELKKRGVQFSLNDMGTVVVGEVADLLTLAAELHELPFAKGAERVYTVIKIDDRRDKKVQLGEKTRSVKAKSAQMDTG